MRTIETSEDINRDRRRTPGTAAVSVAVAGAPACFRHIRPARPKVTRSVRSASMLRKSSSAASAGASR